MGPMNSMMGSDGIGGQSDPLAGKWDWIASAVFGSKTFAGQSMPHPVVVFAGPPSGYSWASCGWRRTGVDGWEKEELHVQFGGPLHQP